MCLKKNFLVFFHFLFIVYLVYDYIINICYGIIPVKLSTNLSKIQKRFLGEVCCA